MTDPRKLGIAFRAGMAFSLGRGLASGQIAVDSSISKKIQRWITIKGTHIPIGKRGIPVNKVGKKISSQSNWKPPKSLESRYGREVAVGLTGYDALKKLQQEGEGYIHAAFHRSDIGDIDAVWGNPDSYGISHVIKRRGAENVDLDGFLKQISETIENGEIKYDEKRNNYNILYKRQMIIVSKEYDGENVHLIVTGFRTRKKKL